MRHSILLFIGLFMLTSLGNVSAQKTLYKKQDSDHIKAIFEAWNEKSGDYLYESVAALVMHQQQPERPEGVYSTPFELLQSMNPDRIGRLKRAAELELEKEKALTRGKREAYFWQNWIDYIETSTCELQEGSSTGEPHMLTFDGERYDFQNAGDYLLSSSEDGTFMVQTQLFRRFTKDAWSLNGGVVMNVNGDIVEFRGTEAPIDGEVYVNEVLISERNTTLNLPNGGTIRLNEVAAKNKNRHVRGDRYVVKWPTGEHVRVGIIRNFNFGDNEEVERKNVLYQLYVGVPKCRSDYSGLLGNNDGIKNDLVVNDTSTINNDRSSYSDEELFGDLRNSPEVISKNERSCFYISRTFGDTYQLSEKTSLFPIQMTAISDSIRYPTRCVTLADASDEQIAEARRKSEEAGISRDEMYSTVFDYTYANIDPKDQVDNPKPEEPIRTGSNEPVLNKDENQTNPVINKDPTPDTKSVPSNPTTTSQPRTTTQPRRTTQPRTSPRPPTRTQPNTQTKPGTRADPGTRSDPSSTTPPRKPSGGR
ncbi:MAG TPA: hypothetical protein VFD77_04250 [Brumimicrobium sp.]|nr:hypothetical protein [Brumimicrobium sp.]